jgi:hypothetical protein
MSDGGEKKKKGGRPKSQAGNVPLIFAKARSRVRKEVILQAHTAQELGRYIKWASKAADPPISEEDAMSLTVSTAVEDLMRRDTLWGKVKAEQTSRGEDGDEDDEEDTSPPAPPSRSTDLSRSAPPSLQTVTAGRNGSSPPPVTREP